MAAIFDDGCILDYSTKLNYTNTITETLSHNMGQQEKAYDLE